MNSDNIDTVGWVKRDKGLKPGNLNSHTGSAADAQTAFKGGSDADWPSISVSMKGHNLALLKSYQYVIFY